MDFLDRIDDTGNLNDSMANDARLGNGPLLFISPGMRSLGQRLPDVGDKGNPILGSYRCVCMPILTAITHYCG